MDNNLTVMSVMTNGQQEVCGPKFNENGITRGELDIVGLVVILLFYLAVLIVGLVISWKSSGKWLTSSSTEHMIADRNVGLFLGILTLSATTMGGGYINGTAEYVYTPGFGLVWTQAPYLFSAAMMLSGVLFARKMREGNYVTMVDPFEQRYGHLFTTLSYIAVAMGDIFWASAILSALGATLSVIIGLSHQWAIIISSAIAVIYTFTGGLSSVIYTDVIQLVFIVFGLWLCIPFAFTHDAVSPIGQTAWGYDGWLGGLKANYWLGFYVDSALMLLFGGTAWSPLYQRVLSQKDARKAEIMCYVSCAVCIFLTIPPVLISAIAKSTDWNATDYVESGCIPMRPDDYKLILPFVLYYLTPFAVAIIGLSAVSAAVMSSCDSAMLSTASIFAKNIYKPYRDMCFEYFGKDKASERELLWGLRIAILVTAFIATVMAITVNSIYGLFFLAGDLNYVFLFPQLIAVLYIKTTNSYGAVTSAIVSYFLRFTAGEPFLNFDPVIKYPWFDEPSQHQLFPFKTLAMFITLGINIAVSYLAQMLFTRCNLPLKYDMFNCFQNKDKQSEDENVEMKNCGQC